MINGVSKPIETFLNYLHDCESQYRMAEADELEMSSVSQDILHELELVEHTYHQNAALAKELTDVRKARRMAKDKMTVYEPLLQFTQENPGIIKKLEQLLGTVRKAEKSTGDRIYTPRTRRTKK